MAVFFAILIRGTKVDEKVEWSGKERTGILFKRDVDKSRVPMEDNKIQKRFHRHSKRSGMEFVLLNEKFHKIINN